MTRPDRVHRSRRARLIRLLINSAVTMTIITFLFTLWEGIGWIHFDSLLSASSFAAGALTWMILRGWHNVWEHILKTVDQRPTGQPDTIDGTATDPHPEGAPRP